MAEIMTGLLPCPFCGGEAHVTETARYGNRYGVRCSVCGAFLGFYSTEDEAIAAWNTRAEMSYEDALILLDELGLSERTCKQKRLFNLIRRKCDGERYEWHGEEMPNYCPNCGAKVVSE